MDTLVIDDLNINELEKFFKHIRSRSEYIKPTKISYDELKINILMKNIPFGIDKCYVKSSKIHGLGVFSKEKIHKNEIITFYPGHWVISYLCENPEIGKESDILIFHNEEVEKRKLKYDDFLRIDYNFAIDRYYGICGDPRIYDDPSYLGHMINDGVEGHHKKDMELYYTVSKDKNNAIYKNIGNVGFCVAIVALRDIEPDEEILISYGYNYWIRD